MPHPPAALAVIVVTRDSARFLPGLRESLAEDLDAVPGGVEVVVVDNASSDGSAEAARSLFAGATVVENPGNTGYAAAVNQGWAATKAPAVLVLNPDVVVLPGAVRGLLAVLEARPRAGVAAPMLLNPDRSLQPSCRRFYTPGSLLAQRTPLGLLPPARRWRDHHLMADLDRSRPHEVDWVTGAAMLIRRSAVDGDGPFDPGYFLYFEDVDLCWRLSREGWTTVYVPASVMVHYHARHSSRMSLGNPYLRHHLASLARFLAKRWRAGGSVRA